ncbi:MULTISPECIES: peptidylprolyl isomerase [unclassified Uliginosibacterium]|uniref:FKBP-type peptidyl-prolyl cis-trans isomerase n=1 Tax=unclassified Uliginosibacterium TaxID=2621521 RepID=UPI000C7CF6FC|nr:MULTISPECIES: FKBP-type peptidyl-prolyl cis-trans isomerase [unclassified Uliginosibacterium]MDO6385673.1 FKBP-type peptidyl-prolyl cis-trans isomerase [Uliginosibacterium sp. 31-12]PLK47638.1 peptidylprolyl isomerase [Uliginosibacterium sp. TH139]
MSTIQPDSLVTLNVRIAHAESGTVMFSSFEATPMTLKLGTGELMPAIESRLIGLSAGHRETFQLASGEAFGPYRDELVEKVDRQHVPAGMDLAEDTVFAFTAPDGSQYPGLVRQLTEAYALVDFNHPLAGHAVSVEVEVIGAI